MLISQFKFVDPKNYSDEKRKEIKRRTGVVLNKKRGVLMKPGSKVPVGYKQHAWARPIPKDTYEANRYFRRMDATAMDTQNPKKSKGAKRRALQEAQRQKELDIERSLRWAKSKKRGYKDPKDFTKETIEKLKKRGIVVNRKEGLLYDKKTNKVIVPRLPNYNTTVRADILINKSGKAARLNNRISNPPKSRARDPIYQANKKALDDFFQKSLEDINSKYRSEGLRDLWDSKAVKSAKKLGKVGAAATLLAGAGLGINYIRKRRSDKGKRRGNYKKKIQKYTKRVLNQ